MLFEHRLFAAHKELASKGVKEPNYDPPLYRLLRRTGWQLRPPHYERFMINLLAATDWHHLGTADVVFRPGT